MVPAPSIATVFIKSMDTDEAPETDHSMEVKKAKDARRTKQGQADEYSDSGSV